jgi:hypothetical protein
MGLLIKLQNGDTALKSLKFGNDRLGGGSSNQPYIKNPILDEPGQLSLADDDFLLRGGLKAPINAIEDVARLTKYMFDFRSPKGLLFIAKQNILSRTSVATEASISAGYGNNPSKELAWTKAPLNQGIYTPLSTLLQAGVGFTGTHLNLLGINPFTPMTGVVQGGFLPGIGLVRYEDVIRGETRLNKTIEVEKWVFKPGPPRSVPSFEGGGSGGGGKVVKVKVKQKVPLGQYENRLLYLWGKDMTNTDNAGGTILTYSGGPGSILGVGKTNIKFADQRTGLNNPLSSTQFKYFYNGGERLHESDTIYQWQLPLGATSKYIEYDENKSFFPYELIEGTNSYQELTIPALFKPGTLQPAIPLTGSDGYQVGLKRPETEVNYNSLLGASVAEGLDSTQTGFDSTSDVNSKFGPQYPYSTLSKNNQRLTLTGSGGYQIGKQNNLTQEPDTTYTSPIEDILDNTYNRQLVSKPQFDDKLVTGEAPVFAATSNGKFIPKYSSFNTLHRDYTDSGIITAGGALWPDFNNPSSPRVHKEGYLADIDKNAGSYKDDNGEIIYFNNGYPGGIAPDFRLTPREKRGLPPLQESAQNPDINSIPKYGTMGKGETYKRWITDGGTLSEVTLDNIYYNSNSVNKSSFRTSNALGSNADIIKFRIGIVNPTKPSKVTTLNFRAYIDDFSDSFSSDWKDQTYMGRAEKFYKYSAFNRSISLGFTIVADNRTNLNAMYKQLNTLAASLAPTYTTFGYMAGNLHQLTIGDYLVNQTGTMSGLTYEIIEDSPWEIEDKSQLPLYIKVSGIKFTPIHSFRPESQFNKVHAYIKQS